MALDLTHAGLWMPIPAKATVPAPQGLAPFVVAGATATARAIGASGGGYTRIPRLGFVSATPSGSTIQIRQDVTTLQSHATASNAGGFLWRCRFGLADPALLTGSRMFIGITDTNAALANQEPASMLNCFGFGHSANQANLRVFYGGTTAQTQINLGGNFPAQTYETDFYDLTIGVRKGAVAGQSIWWWLVERNGGQFRATGEVSGNSVVLPPPGMGLNGFNSFRSNNSSTGAVALDLFALATQVYT